MAENTEEMTTEETNRSQLWKHDAMAEWLGTEEGGEFDLTEASVGEVIAAAFARRVAWRQSDTYQNLVAERVGIVQAEKEAKAIERAEAKAARDAEKAAKAEAKAAAKAEADAAKAEEADSDDAKPAKKAAAKKAPAGRRAARAKKTEEDPFS